MTEKRFYYNTFYHADDMSRVLEYEIIDRQSYPNYPHHDEKEDIPQWYIYIDENDSGWQDMLVDLLNTLHEENEELKRTLSAYSDATRTDTREIKELLEDIEELQEENEQLKKSIKRQQDSNNECAKLIEEQQKENEQLKQFKQSVNDVLKSWSQKNLTAKQLQVVLAIMEELNVR